jgi:hypothetical protein
MTAVTIIRIGRPQVRNAIDSTTARNTPDRLGGSRRSRPIRTDTA